MARGLLMALAGVGLLGAAVPAAEPLPVTGGGQMTISESAATATIGRLVAKHGAAEQERIGRCVREVARLWRPEDGTAEEFDRFCLANFVVGPDRDLLFERFETNLEWIDGMSYELAALLRVPVDVDVGKQIPVDELFAQYNPAAHLGDDLFRSKIAFIALLNFPIFTLEEIEKRAATWGRRQWAEARLAQARLSEQDLLARIPAAQNQAVKRAVIASDGYIFNYNILMDRVVGADGKSPFPEGLRLISHWNLRDEIKARYADPKGVDRQRLIQTIMYRIVNQEIPAVVINNPAVRWDPVLNTVDGKAAPREADVRYQILQATFRAFQALDAYYPDMPTHVDRRFQKDRQLLEADYLTLLEGVLTDPVGKEIGRLIERRLGRKLEPFDIWYGGFKAGGSLDEAKLDRLCQKRYPTAAAFQKDLPRILKVLGFNQPTINFLADHIQVDASRGAGHALEPKMRGVKARLRTRVGPKGMDYKGFNIAMHELGHDVELVFSLYRLDHTLLKGVPATGFSEAFAFVFQARDLEVLGVSGGKAKADPQEQLGSFWVSREIGAVGLVDLKIWRWMYAHPEATPAALREAVVQIAVEVWNTYFAEVIGVRDSPLLAIYSHIINSQFYLPEYFIGHLVAHQVGAYLRGKPLGREMERMCSIGRLTPNKWMWTAIGAPLSTQPLLEATRKALKQVAK